MAKLMATWLPTLRIVLAGAAGAAFGATASGAPLINASAFFVAGRRVMLLI
jgi:hypothetical protein